MMPSPMGGQPPSMPPSGGPPMGQPPMGGPTPPAGGPPPQGGGDLKSTIIQLLTQAKKAADAGGLNWMQLVNSVGGGGAGAGTPPPPAPPAGKRPTPPAGAGGAMGGAKTMNPASTKQNNLY
jgi:hypothetical protein